MPYVLTRVDEVMTHTCSAGIQYSVLNRRDKKVFDCRFKHSVGGCMYKFQSYPRGDVFTDTIENSLYTVYRSVDDVVSCR